jgi:hypothetical protein
VKDFNYFLSYLTVVDRLVAEMLQGGEKKLWGVQVF